jgi:hypothetical protein
MRKFIFIFIFSVFLFVQNANCKNFEPKEILPQGQISEDELSFEQNEFYYHNEGETPSPQVFFSNFPNPSNSFSPNEKSRETSLRLFHTRTKIICKLSHYRAAFFGWHGSALIGLYLRTACFRL